MTAPLSSTINLSSFFFNDTATTEIYTLSLHDALPICEPSRGDCPHPGVQTRGILTGTASQRRAGTRDRKSTRLNSSHLGISYAVFCLKKKNERELLPFADDVDGTYVARLLKR